MRGKPGKEANVTATEHAQFTALLFADGGRSSSTLPTRVGANGGDPSIITLEDFEALEREVGLEGVEAGLDGDSDLRRSTRRLKDRIDQQ